MGVDKGKAIAAVLTIVSSRPLSQMEVQRLKLKWPKSHVMTLMKGYALEQ